VLIAFEKDSDKELSPVVKAHAGVVLNDRQNVSAGRPLSRGVALRALMALLDFEERRS
jgi:hypothetical protein